MDNLSNILSFFVFIGEQGIEVFWREANKRNICIALRQKVPSDASNETYENVSLLDSNLKSMFYIRWTHVLVLIFYTFLTPDCPQPKKRSSKDAWQCQRGCPFCEK